MVLSIATACASRHARARAAHWSTSAWATSRARTRGPEGLWTRWERRRTRSGRDGQQAPGQQATLLAREQLAPSPAEPTAADAIGARVRRATRTEAGAPIGEMPTLSVVDRSDRPASSLARPIRATGCNRPPRSRRNSSCSSARETRIASAGRGGLGKGRHEAALSGSTHAVATMCASLIDRRAH